MTDCDLAKWLAAAVTTTVYSVCASLAIVTDSTSEQRLERSAAHWNKLDTVLHDCPRWSSSIVRSQVCYGWPVGRCQSLLEDALMSAPRTCEWSCKINESTSSDNDQTDVAVRRNDWLDVVTRDGNRTEPEPSRTRPSFFKQPNSKN